MISVNVGVVTLQVEFKNRQRCNKFAKFIKKGMNRFYDCKAERCVWMKFDSLETRNNVKEVLLKQVKECEVKYRESGVDYLFVN